jgi:hypothetical protein
MLKIASTPLLRIRKLEPRVERFEKRRNGVSNVADAEIPGTLHAET